MRQPTELNAWKKLKGHAPSVLKPNSTNNRCIEHELLSLDYSAQLLDEFTLKTLVELAHESNLQEQIQALFTGQPVNYTEQRPALHTALRALDDEVIYVNGRNVVPEVVAVKTRMQEISEQIRNGQWLGYSGKPITDVVNIGIGGSMLGPFFCIDALKDEVTEKLEFHFIAEIDPRTFSRVTSRLNPETTLFIVSSKSFTTPETLYNMEKALAWMGQKQHWDKHFIAVTAQVERAREFGFKHIIPIWDWVGGRYSLCSAINLITSIAIGYESFSAILSGAREMDVHFRTCEFAQNLPVMLALIGIWNINFLNHNNLLLLTYSEDLQHLVPYLQQLDMESNGKSINKYGRRIEYPTGPIIWGGPGNHAQHSYYQLLCQGTHKITADLISMKAFDNEAINKMCLGHRKALSDGIVSDDNPFSLIPGDMPLNHLSVVDGSPKALGALIALYEHKIFVQGAIWNINSFDQPGVESSKKIFKEYA